ncbi:MAG: hypothetical protein Q8P18_12195 [Pseudomonadota bacterium]|nr:hypothetical protein [Pseudomonadota bacterium]
MTTHDLTTRLATLTRDQLAALVERLVARHPDLEDLAHLPLPGEIKRADGAGVRAHVTGILRTMGDDWRASTRAQYELDPIIAMGHDYRAQGLLEDAGTVYRAVIDGVLPIYERIRDEESEIGNIVGECVEGLGECVAAAKERGMRERFLADVFYVYHWDTLGHGGYGMDGPAEKVLLTRTTDTEKDLAAKWLHDALSPERREGNSYGRRNAGALILRLVGDRLDATSREATYAEAGMGKEHVDLLLAAGRHAEAIELLRGAGGELITVADRLVAAGLGAEATEVVDQHPAVLELNAHALRDWLVKRGRADKAAIEELVWALQRFTRSPLVGAWEELRTQAEATGRWHQVLPHALAAVDNEKSSAQPARARVLAVAGSFDEAEAVLARLPEGSWKRAALDVAAAAESARPDLARSLYARIAELLRAKGTKPAREELAAIRTRVAALAHVSALAARGDR